MYRTYITTGMNKEAITCLTQKINQQYLAKNAFSADIFFIDIKMTKRSDRLIVKELLRIHFACDAG